MKIRLSIVIPNYNGRKFLPACLRSIRGQTLPDYSIIVVDNGSTDGSRELLKREFPEVRVISMGTNTGFSRAINAGIQSASTPYIFLLNNDTELPRDTLEKLVSAAENKKEFSFFVPKMLSYHQRNILDGAGDGYLRGGAGYRLGTLEDDGDFYNHEGPVFGACAAAVLYRRSLFEKVGLFDEDFFAYLEDVDLNLRINRAGLQGYYLPCAVIYHIGSATSGSKINAFTVSLSTRNSFFILFKHYQLSLFLRLLPVIVIYQFCWLLFVVKKRQVAAWGRGISQALRGVMRMRRKHVTIRANDRLTTSELNECLRQAEQSVVSSIMHRRTGQGKGNRLLRLYCMLFL